MRRDEKEEPQTGRHDRGRTPKCHGKDVAADIPMELKHEKNPGEAMFRTSSLLSSTNPRCWRLRGGRHEEQGGGGAAGGVEDLPPRSRQASEDRISGAAAAAGEGAGGRTCGTAAGGGGAGGAGDPITQRLGKKEQKKHYSSFELNNVTFELVNHPSTSSLCYIFLLLFQRI
jgi:hypothetical protein